METNDSVQLIELTAQNLAQEHICCAIGANLEARRQAAEKKAWMARAFEEGYRFFKADVRGKAFIEVTPAESAWAPINAPGWLYIGCFWVAGSHKGRGLGAKLLQRARAEAERLGCQGLAAMAPAKKQPFLSNGKYYKAQGFAVADTALPYYELLALPLREDATPPRFAESVRQLALPPEGRQGVYILWSGQCPHTPKYALLLAQAAERLGVACHTRQLKSAAEAQSAPNPFPTWAMFYNGEFVTNEIFSEAKLESFLQSKPGR